MAALQTKLPEREAVVQKELVDALERGEIVGLMADMVAGRITVDQLHRALQAHDRAHPFRRFLLALLGRS